MKKKSNAVDYLMSSFLKQDPRDYFDSQQANALKPLGDAGSGVKTLKFNVSSVEAYGSLRELISEIRVTGLSEPITDPEVAFKVLRFHIYVVCRY